MYIAGDELVCQVGSTQLEYQARAIEDPHAWLLEQKDWVPLGAADESKPGSRRVRVRLAMACSLVVWTKMSEPA
jgi:hypothetical protein